MSISAIIKESFQRSFDLYQDLVDEIDESILDSKLFPIPSNTVGLQLWCVVGARESFATAILANQWSGFSCSLESTTNKNEVADALRQSSQKIDDLLEKLDEFSDIQDRLIIDLLEHEASHHGQLIRYIYGLKIPIPKSWKSKYALKDLAD